MQRDIKRVCQAAILMFICIVFAGTALAWGPDVPVWTGGKVNCFDTDYSMTGTMYVAFQPYGQTQILVYRSTDHGLSWHEFKVLSLAGINSGALNRIKTVLDESNAILHILHVNSSGYLVHWTVSTIFTPVPAPLAVSDGAIIEDSFDAAWNLKSGADGRIAARWMLGSGAGGRYVIRTFDTSTWTWTTTADDTWIRGANERMSMAFGPPSNFFCASSALPFSNTSYEIGVKKSADNGATWDALGVMTSNSYNDYDPRVAAANVNNSGVWAVFNRDKGSHQIDLLFKYSPDGGANWNASEYTVSATAGADEYVSDIKFYKGTNNQYVNMVYISDDPTETPVRKAYWVWTSTSDPTHWSGKTQVNDQDVTPWPENVAPRIVYSPGAAGSGGGVVFSRIGQMGLYFDAPWVPATATTHPLVVTVQGSGNVTSNPAGIDCTSPHYLDTEMCSAAFASGSTVTLTATPINGADYTTSFIGWEGACTGAGPCSVAMTDIRTVKALFGSLPPPVYAVPLSVTVLGSGRVTSSPSVIECEQTSFGTKVCTENVLGGSTVTLTATPIDGLGYTTSFIGWEGDCSGTGTCVLSMTAARSVTARFGSLAPPVYALPLPSSGQTYVYSGVAVPVESPTKADAKPIGVGNVAGGTVSLNIAMHEYAGAVDVYVALLVPAVSSEIFLIDSARALWPLSSAGLVPFRSGIAYEGIREALFGDIPVSLLPASDYILGLFVTPAGSTAAYDFWVTSFTIP